LVTMTRSSTVEKGKKRASDVEEEGAIKRKK
jgi:hypothetical protein